MRKIETIKLDGHDELSVFELTIGQIMDIFDFQSKGEMEIKDYVIKEVLPKCVRDKDNNPLDEEKIKQFTPSELKKVYDKFMEVNSDFFLIAKQMGAMELIKSIGNAIMSNFLTAFYGSLNEDTTESSSTDTPSS